MGDERKLSDEDIEAIVNAFLDKFRLGIGSGVLSLAWKGAIIGMLFVAAYGLIKIEGMK